MSKLLVGWLTLFALLAHLPVYSASVEGERLINFDIVAQGADLSLIEFAKQADITMLYPFDVVKHRNTATLKGSYTILNGINVLIKNSGLQAKLTNTDQLSITLKQPLKETNNVLTHKKNKLSPAIISAFASLFVTQSLSAAEVKEEGATESIERIEVTGSRIKRTEMEGPSPVTIITADDMAAQGQLTVFDALSSITQNTGNVIGDDSIGSFTPNAQVVNLRGFGPGYTLTLINGRRMASYPAAYNSDTQVVNFGAIPTAAIKQIEILASGASAIYGSDAVAGVINIVLKDDIDETTLTALGGTTTNGGGDSYRLQLTTGMQFDKGHVTLAAEYHDQNMLLGSERSWLDSFEDSPLPTDRQWDHEVAVISTWNQFGMATDNYGNGLKYISPSEQDCARTGQENWQVQPAYNVRDGQRVDLGNVCGFDTTGGSSLRGAREKSSLFVSGEYELADELTLISDVLYYSSKSQSRDSVSRVIFGASIDPSISRETIFGTMPELGYKIRNFHADEIGRSTDSEYDESSVTFNVGLQGSFGDDYEWDLIYTNSQYDYEQGSIRVKEEKVYEYYLGTEVNGPFGPTYLWDGKKDLYDPLTQEEADDIFGWQTRTAETTSQAINFAITGTLFTVLDRDIQFALVAEYEEQTYDARSDDRTLNTEGKGFYFSSGGISKGDRQRSAIGTEFLIPLFDNFEVTLAARYDKYDSESSEIGGKVTPQAKFSYRPFDWVLLRGGAAGIFRAPDMNAIYTDTSSFVNFRDYSKCRQTYEAQNGNANGFELDTCPAQWSSADREGSNRLKDEKGVNYGLGFVVEPLEGMSLTFDYYQIELEDMVVTEGADPLFLDEYNCNYGEQGVGEGRCNYVNNNITRQLNAETGISEVTGLDIFPVNQAGYRQKGIDAEFSYSFATDFGAFRFKAAYTHILATERQQSSDSEWEDIRDIASHTEPRSKVQLQLGYVFEGLFTNFSVYRTGSIPAFRQSPEAIEASSVDRLDPYVTVNWVVGYQFSDALQANLTARNLFDERAPQDDTRGHWPYYNTSAYAGAGIGREVLAEVRYTF